MQLLVLPSLPEEMLVMLPVPRPWAVLLENKPGAAKAAPSSLPSKPAGRFFACLGEKQPEPRWSWV